MASETHEQSPANGGGPSIKETFGLNNYRFTKGKWVLLGVAGAMVGVGLVLAVSSPDTARHRASTTGATSPRPELLGSSFAESGSPGEGVSPAVSGQSSLSSQDFSTFMVKGGFGAFVGFALGFAIRSFIRLAMVMVGFYLLTLTVMSYLGWVEIHWAVMEAQFNQAVTTLGEQMTSIQAFLTGAIPSSGMATLGLAMGLRKA